MSPKLLLSKTDRLTLDAVRVLANDVTFKGEYNPHGVKLWVISHQFGPVAAVWASCEQDALDEAVDADLMQAFAVEEETVYDMDGDERTTASGGAIARLGNASEPFDLTDCSIRTVPQEDMPMPLLLAFAEARGEGADTLDDVKSAALATVRE